MAAKKIAKKAAKKLAQKKSGELLRVTKAVPRLARGRSRAEALFPAAPPKAALPAGYGTALSAIKASLQYARVRAVLAANPVVLEAYWQTGKVILARQEQAGWGTRVIDRLAGDLRAAFPDMGGLSARNLLAMKVFAREFPDGPIAQQPVAQLPWGHVLQILQRTKTAQDREFYIRECIQHGWSRSILELQIERHAHKRQGKTVHNFKQTLPPLDSDMAAQVFKDPYLFDFLGTADPRREREVEQALMDHVQAFLLELGAGFAFVGRQVHLEIGDNDYYADLLFYHLKLRRYVVIELKAVAFEPGFIGQMNMYLSAVDDLLKHADDKPTIGLLLCRSKNRLQVEYALRGVNKPLGVANWQTQLTTSLPKQLRGSLPSIAEIEAELAPKRGKK
jgi:predicted nuclease of restriction endonuclease-like (RecB) superfamily